MLRTLLCLALLATTAACSGSPKPLPRPDGQVFRLNPDKWGDTPNDLRTAGVPR